VIKIEVIVSLECCLSITANVKAFVKARISWLVRPKPAQLLNYKLSHSRNPSAVLAQMQCWLFVPSYFRLVVFLSFFWELYWWFA
jgi:hypothetical protein